MNQIIKTDWDVVDAYQAEKAQREAAEKAAKDAEMAKLEAAYQQQEAAYQQQQAEAFRARVASKMPHLKAIAACIDRYETSIDESNGRLMVGGFDMIYTLEFVDPRPHSRWQHARSAAITVRPQRHGDRPSRFPQHRTGEYSYAKIAAELVSIVASTIEQRRREAAVAANTELATAVREA